MARKILISIEHDAIGYDGEDIVIAPIGKRLSWEACDSNEIQTLEIKDEVFKELEEITKKKMLDEIDKAEADADEQKAQDSQAPA